MRKLFEVRRQRERGETSLEDESSSVGTRVQSSSLETLEAGCRISVVVTPDCRVKILQDQNVAVMLLVWWPVMYGRTFLSLSPKCIFEFIQVSWVCFYQPKEHHFILLTKVWKAPKTVMMNKYLPVGGGVLLQKEMKSTLTT